MARKMSNGATYYGPDSLFEFADAFNHPKEWLYGPWTKEKYDAYKILNTIPGIFHYMDYLLSVRSDEEYLGRYGMDYSDIHDPRKLGQTDSARALVGATYHYVSSNIKRLYG